MDELKKIGAKVKYTGRMWSAIVDQIGEVINLFPNGCWVSFPNSSTYILSYEMLQLVHDDEDSNNRHKHAMRLL